MIFFFFFFFSSRRRHTRWPRDWSSDVCSSDLINAPCTLPTPAQGMMTWAGVGNVQGALMRAGAHKGSVQEVLLLRGGVVGSRSEERRVGKECRSGGWR